MKILITGGAGYIGSHVNKLLNKNGYSTIVFDNLSTGNIVSAKWGQFVKGDLSDPVAVDKLFKENKISAVMHFAASAYVGESIKNPQKYYTNNLMNTINLLNAMINNNVLRIVFSSTCATYGIPTTIPIAEDHAQNPINPYGQTKLFIEKIINDYSLAYDLKFVVLRYFNAAGADPDVEIGEIHNPETHLIPLVIDAALGVRKNIEIFGDDYNTPDGTCIRDYIHVTDLAEAHFLSLGHILTSGHSNTFNLSNETGYSIKEIIECVKSILKKSPKIKVGPRRTGDPPVLIGSSQKFRQVMGWKPRFEKIDTIIGTALKWHKKLYDI